MPEPYIPPPETKNRLAELLNEDDDVVGGGDSAGGPTMNDEDHTTSVVEAEVYEPVDHDDITDLPPPPPIDFDPAFDQVAMF